jgi:threonine dehydratase
MSLLAQAVERAEARIRPWILETPLEPSPLGPFLKLENLQHTGSFKARGAFSKLLTLSPHPRSRGVIAASTGNHGAAVAYAAGKLGLEARIVVPEGADAGKLDRIRELGGAVEIHGNDSALAESYARRLAEQEGIVYLSPYNDLDVVAGQGTTGVELGRQLPHADVVFIALGGGGLLAGTAAWLKELWPHLTVVGCSPENSAVMIHSIRAGKILELESRPTLSDGTAGGIEPGAITFDLCRDLADEFLTLSEAEIRSAMQRVLETSGYRVEGAAGVAVAGYLRQAEQWRGRTAVAILCGGNVAPSVFETMDRS